MLHMINESYRGVNTKCVISSLNFNVFIVKEVEFIVGVFVVIFVCNICVCFSWFSKLFILRSRDIDKPSGSYGTSCTNYRFWKTRIDSDRDQILPKNGTVRSGPRVVVHDQIFLKMIGSNRLETKTFQKSGGQLIGSTWSAKTQPSFLNQSWTVCCNQLFNRIIHILVWRFIICHFEIGLSTVFYVLMIPQFASWYL